MIVPRYYEDLSVPAWKTQCQPEPIMFRHPKEWTTWWNTGKKSDRMQLLNGTWKFQYYNSIYDISGIFF